jgi:hypothetical protein
MTLIPKYSKITSANRTMAEKFGDVVSVKDYGATGDGATDDTTAIQAAIASGHKTIYFPDGTYLLSSAISLPSTTNLCGENKNVSIIKCATNVHAYTYITCEGNNIIADLAINNTTTVAGTGIDISGGTYTFTGHVLLSNVGVNGFAIGINVNSAFDVSLENCSITGNTIGLNATPPTNGGDNGYINCLYISKCYFHLSGTYDVYFKASVRISNASFTDTIFDPGASIASVYLHTVNPITFDNCYFEPTGVVESVNCSLVSATFSNCYFLNANSVTCTSADNQVSFDNCRALVIYANSVQNNVQISNCGCTGTFATGLKLNIINSTVNGVYYPSKFKTLTLGTGDAVDYFVGFTKSITQVITANTSANIIGDQALASDKVWGAGMTGVASFSNGYFPGLVLTVTCATTNSASFFCVVATNTTAANITITAKTLNVILQQMSTYTSL